ncbi:hypothetical protein ACEPAF_7386 [Sanghuangporus sanghuang]
MSTVLLSWRSRHRQVPPSSITFTSNISATNPMPIPITYATQGTAKIRGFVPRSTDSDDTKRIAVFSVQGGLPLFFKAFSSRANEAVTTRLEYRILRTSSEVEDRHMSTYAAAPISPVATVQQIVGEAFLDSPAHPLESLPQSDATQQTSTTLSEGVPDVLSSSGRTISLMQREIDELRTRVDELTRRQQPESARHFYYGNERSEQSSSFLSECGHARELIVFLKVVSIIIYSVRWEGRSLVKTPQE